MTVLLLFLPEQNAEMKIITVQHDQEYSFDIDEVYDSSRKGRSDTILEVKIGGSFLG